MKLIFRYDFTKKILIGLTFSCFGDFLLVWPSYFIFGMLMFSVAQLMYITAFGFVPLNAKLGAILYGMCGIGIFSIYYFCYNSFSFNYA